MPYTIWLSNFATFLWCSSITGTVAVIIFFIIQRIVRKQVMPQVMFVAGTVLLLRFIIPIGFTLPFSIFDIPFLEKAYVSFDPPSDVSPKPPEVFYEQKNITDPALLRKEQAKTLNPIIHPAGLKHYFALKVKYAIIIIWFIGFFAFCAIHLWKHLQFIRWQKQYPNQKCDPAIEKMVNAILAEQNLKPLPINIIIAPFDFAAATAGVFRPQLYISNFVLEHYSEKDLKNLIRHEVAHISKRDHWMNFLTIAVRAIHWFNPFVHLLAYEIMAIREILRDSQAVSPCPEERPSMAKLLLKVNQDFCHHSANWKLASPFFSGQSDALRYRIQMMLQPQAKNLLLIPSIILAAFCVVIAFGMAKEPPRPYWAVPNKQVSRPPNSSALFQSISHRRLVYFSFIKDVNGYQLFRAPSPQVFDLGNGIELTVSFNSPTLRVMKNPFHGGSIGMKYKNTELDGVEISMRLNGKANWLVLGESPQSVVPYGGLTKNERVELTSIGSDWSITNLGFSDFTNALGGGSSIIDLRGGLEPSRQNYTLHSMWVAETYCSRGFDLRYTAVRFPYHESFAVSIHSFLPDEQTVREE
ncbi:MAG: M56 family metallopeptidase [Verrucomicrobiota bacterium]